MKSKEYINAFKIQNGWNSQKQKAFLSELTQELVATFELFDKPDDEHIFNVSVNMIRQKWDSISKKIPFGLPDNMWSYFYATVIVPFKKESCPTFVKQQQFKEKERREKQERYERIYDPFETMEKEGERKYTKRLIDGFAAFLLSCYLDTIPNNSFEYFDLDSNASEDDVMKAFHARLLKVHPDKGGNKEDAILCIENKNKCIQYLKSKKV